MATTVAAPARQAGLFSSTLVVAKRATRKFLRSPQLHAAGSDVPDHLPLRLRRAISSGGGSYVDFLVPGFVTTSVLFAGMGAAAGVAEDLQQGFVDRLRSLPIPRSSVLTGRVLADTASLAWAW